MPKFSIPAAHQSLKFTLEDAKAHAVVGIMSFFRPSPSPLEVLGYSAKAKSCLNAISRKP
jgi:hypothetical protein